MIYDLCNGASVANTGHNRRPNTATGQKSLACSPEELVAWAMLELAIDDTAILCRYGLIDAQGECHQWPMVTRRNWRGEEQTEYMIIANMRHPHDHHRIKEFWLDPSQAQLWCDLCGCRLPAADIWKSILENHAK